MIDRLERRGLLRRTIHPRDKRSFRLELTAAGRAVQREHHRVEMLIARRMLESLPNEAARRQFVELLSQMTERLRTEKRGDLP
jgi:DNA-binding MarR family transcriptional regulator